MLNLRARLLFSACLWMATAAWNPPATAQESATDPAIADELSVVDRLVAVVDDDPMFLSDVDRLLALGLVDASPAAELEERRRVALDRLIEERLRLHEVERYELGTVPVPEVDRQMAALAESLGGEEALERLLASQDMDCRFS